MLKFSRYLPALILSVGLLPSAWLLYRFPDTPQLGMAGDDVMYMGVARSLADGQGYREAALPGNPWQTKYPPGYPVMLAAILKVSPAAQSFWIIAHSWVWLALASVTLTWAMRQTGLTPMQAAVIGALWAANPSGANAGVLALADAPFCALLFLVLGLLLRLDKAASWNAAHVGLIMGMACLIRSAGMIAICGLVGWLLWRRNFRTAFWFGASASVLPALWMLWSHWHLPSGYGPVAEFYFSYSSRWLQTVREAGLESILVTNARFTLKSLADWLVPFETGLVLQTLAYIVLVAFGCAALAEWKGGPVTAVALTMAAFQLIWNWSPNGRFFLPVAPAFLGAGVTMLSSRPAFLRIFILAVVAIADVYGTSDLARDYASWKDAGFAPVYTFIKTELPSEAAILGDERVWLSTGRRVVGMPMPMEYFYRRLPDSQMEFFMSYKDVARQFAARYVLLEPWDGVRWNVPFERAEQFADAMRSDPDLERIFSQNGVELFRIRGHDPGSP